MAKLSYWHINLRKKLKYFNVAFFTFSYYLASIIFRRPALMGVCLSGSLPCVVSVMIKFILARGCRCEFDDWRLHVACMLQPIPFPEQ